MNLLLETYTDKIKADLIIWSMVKIGEGKQDVIEASGSILLDGIPIQ